jgi:hypothetical protein
MHESEVDHDRRMLLEAFTAGWQAGLAVTITHPRVLEIVGSCFDQWLDEAADEVEVLGLAFRRRTDLPVSTARDPHPGPEPEPAPESQEVPIAAKHRIRPVRGPQQVPA